jgi:hypothetical protein
MRELMTIGDLGAARPAARSRARRRMTMGFVDAIGVTNPNFLAPTNAQMGIANQPLLDAADALAAYFATHGVPSEHTSDPQVLAFQQAWNDDPVSGINAAASQLSDDGAYGPNTRAALNAFGLYQDFPVNSGAGPAPPPPAPAPSPSPPLVVPRPVTPATTEGKSALPLLLVLGAVGLGAWLLFFRKKKRGGGGSRHTRALITVKNPRGGRRRNPTTSILA